MAILGLLARGGKAALTSKVGRGLLADAALTGGLTGAFGVGGAILNADDRKAELYNEGERGGKYRLTWSDKLLSGLTGINQDSMDAYRLGEYQRLAKDANDRFGSNITVNKDTTLGGLQGMIDDAEAKRDANNKLETAQKVAAASYNTDQARYERITNERNRREDNNRFYQQRMDQMDMYRMGIEREDRRDRRDARMQLVAALTGSLGNLGDAFLSI